MRRKRQYLNGLISFANVIKNFRSADESVSALIMRGDKRNNNEAAHNSDAC